MLLNVFTNVILPRALTPGPSWGTEANINTDVHLETVWVFRSELLCERQPSAFYCAPMSISESTCLCLSSGNTGRVEGCGEIFNVVWWGNRSWEKIVFISGNLRLWGFQDNAVEGKGHG